MRKRAPGGGRDFVRLTYATIAALIFIQAYNFSVVQLWTYPARGRFGGSGGAAGAPLPQRYPCQLSGHAIGRFPQLEQREIEVGYYEND